MTRKHFNTVMVRLDPRLSGSPGSENLFAVRVPSHLVMAARVAAIHVFGASGKDVDGRDDPGHEGEKTPCWQHGISGAATTATTVPA
jgi:hypothetical protein